MKVKAKILLGLTMFIAVNLAGATDAVISLKGCTPYMVEGDSTGLIDRISSSLTNVGIGSKIYLLANEGNSGISGYVWTLSRPAGSAAALSGTTIQNPIFVPDVGGTYNVTLTITDSTGTSAPASMPINAASYCGVGTVGGMSPSVPQCAVCHASKETEWNGTGHAHFLEENLSSGPSYYGASCISCHTVGYDTDPAAVNNGFDDRATQYSWTFPSPFTPDPANWTNLVNNFSQVAVAANIQCENCHGPGSAHSGATNDSKMVSSLAAPVCGQCHDAPPHHNYYRQWEGTLHANPVVEEGASCVKCHSGIGFVQYVTSGDSSDTGYMPITCGTCHDPHSDQNEHQIRTLADIQLGNGEVLIGGGMGKLCMNCHKSRRNAEIYASAYHSNFGPHHGPQADMLAGKNAIDYGQAIPSTPHYNAVSNTCVGCHMSVPDSTMANEAGQHTWKMSSNGVDNVAGCLGCHPGISSFEDIMAPDDWDGDGATESVVGEIDGLVDNLGNLLPPDGPSVVVTQDFTSAQLLAAYNYKSAVEDQSHGVHNADFTRGILQASIDDMMSGIKVVTTPVLPMKFALHQNFPNPFNPVTNIRFDVARSGLVRVNVYNLGGQVVARLVNQEMQPGIYQATFNGANLSSGIYIAQMDADGLMLKQKMVLVK